MVCFVIKVLSWNCIFVGFSCILVKVFYAMCSPMYLELDSKFKSIFIFQTLFCRLGVSFFLSFLFGINCFHLFFQSKISCFLSKSFNFSIFQAEPSISL